jgi:putative aldouronate transport system substrate-binding protein
LGDQLYAQFPKIQGIYSDGNWCDANQQPSEFAATRSEFDNEFLDNYGFKLVTEFLTMPTEESPAYYPVWGYTVPDGSDAQTAINELTDLENTYLPRIIIADEDKFDAAWDDYMARMEKINTQAYLDWVNSEIKARME